MRTQTLTWTAGRDGHDRLPRRTAARSPSPTSRSTAVGVWLLLGTIAATTLAMGTAILWAAPSIATGAILAALAGS